MVVPLPGGPALMGPPPPEFASQFRKIKFLLKLMIFATFLKFLTGMFLIGPFSVFMSSMYLVINSLMGIFLLRDDPQFTRIYNYLATNCFGACAQQCGGGMQCLTPFALTNFATAIMDVLGGPVYNVVFYSNGGIPVDPKVFAELDDTTKAVFQVNVTLWIVSILLAFVAETGCAYIGYQVYKEIAPGGGGDYMPLGGGPTAGGGGFGDPASRRGMPGPTPYGAQTGSGGGRAVGGGGRPAPQGQNFAPFQGQGQKLGR